MRRRKISSSKEKSRYVMMVRGGGVDAARQRKEHRQGGYSSIKNSNADLCDLAVIQFHVLSLHVSLLFLPLTSQVRFCDHADDKIPQVSYLGLTSTVTN